MKVNCQFDLPEDVHQFNLFNISHRMHQSLVNISKLLSEFKKRGLEEPILNEILEDIQEEIYNSKIEEIE